MSRRPARRRPGARRRAGRSIRTSSTVAGSRRLRAYGDRRLEAGGRPVGESRAAGVEPALGDGLKRWRSTAASRWSSATSQTETPYPSCGQARAARTATALQREHRGRVGQQPDPVRRDITVTRASLGGLARPSPPRRSGRRGAPAGRSPRARGRGRRPRAGSSPARQRSTSRCTSPARHDDHALAGRGPGVGLGERREQLEHLDRVEPGRSPARRSPGRRGRGWWRSPPAAGGGVPASRSVAVSTSPKPIRVAIARAIGSPATLCSVSSPLPMSCSSAATISTSGRATVRISAEASMQVSTTCRSTVKRWMTEACGSSRIRSHSGRIVSSAPVSSSVSQTGSRPRPEASSRTSSWRRLVGPRLRHRRALADQAGAGGRRQHDVALGRLGGRAQQHQRVLVGAGLPGRAPPRCPRARCPGRPGSGRAGAAAPTSAGPARRRRGAR